MSCGDRREREPKLALAADEMRGDPQLRLGDVDRHLTSEPASMGSVTPVT